jgi:hypothetical protein
MGCTGSAPGAGCAPYAPTMFVVCVMFGTWPCAASTLAAHACQVDRGASSYGLAQPNCRLCCPCAPTMFVFCCCVGIWLGVASPVLQFFATCADRGGGLYGGVGPAFGAGYAAHTALRCCVSCWRFAASWMGGFLSTGHRVLKLFVLLRMDSLLGFRVLGFLSGSGLPFGVVHMGGTAEFSSRFRPLSQ